MTSPNAELVKELLHQFNNDDEASIKTCSALREAADAITRLEGQLAEARKALEEIYSIDSLIMDGGKCHDLGPCAEIAAAALTDDQREVG